MSAIIMASAWYTDPGTWFALAKAIFGIGLVIFVHELGHFLVAKACGVKCEKFYVGFDVPLKIGPWKLPRTLWKKQHGETEYGIGIIPLGGYVKMLGQDDNPANAEAEAERTKVRKTTATEEGAPSNSEAGEEEFEVDPRSYTAKTVPQRMAIISAGVIVNAVTSVLFAALAFGIGVKYTTCTVGTTSPGSPAWLAGLEPGDKIIQIGRDGEPSEDIRFDKDLRERVMIWGADKKIDFLVRRVDQTEEWITVQPVIRDLGGAKAPQVGLGPATSATLAENEPTLKGSSAAQATATVDGNDRSLTKGDTIVMINGEPVENGYEIAALLGQSLDQSLTLTIQPAEVDGESAASFEMVLAPTTARSTGIVLGVGPVTGMFPGGPADAAGIESGDQILAINGAPVGDPLHLNEELRQLAGSPTELTVLRDKNEITLSVTPQDATSLRASYAAPLSLAAIGAVFTIDHTIAAIEPDSPAEAAGFLVGDKLTEFRMQAPEGNDDLADALGRQNGEPIELGEENQSWAFVHDQLAMLPQGIEVQLELTRGDDKKTLSLVPVEQADRFIPSRGLHLTGMSGTLQADGLGNAFWLGLRQAKEDGAKIFTVLKQLVTGNRSMTDLGGPVVIAAAATQEASQGVPRLLIFLTFLSINLAIINFLPIPVLDGGHMVLLAYEGIRGKPAPAGLIMLLTNIGLCLLLTLMVFVFGMDIYRVIKMFF